MAFPLLRLEPLIIRDALQHTTVFDVVNFATSTPTTYSLVARKARQPLSEVWLSLSDGHYITIVGPKKNGRSNYFEWHFYRQGHPEIARKRDVAEKWRQEVYIGGGVRLSIICQVMWTIHPPIKRLVTICNDTTGTMEKVLKFLETIFKPPTIRRIRVDTDHFLDFQRMRGWNISKGGLIHMNLHAQMEYVTAETVRQVLDGFRMENFRLLVGRLNERFVYEKPIKIPTIRISGEWITAQNLFDLDSVNVYFRMPDVTCNDLNTFVRKWIQGEACRRLRTLFIVMIPRAVHRHLMTYCVQTFPKTSITYVKDDVDANQWNSDMADGFDVRRETDGRRATVQWRDVSFIMHVR